MNVDEKIEYLRRKGEQKRRSRRWYKKWWVILLFIILSLILIYLLSIIFLAFRIAKNPQEADLLLRSGLLKSNEIVNNINKNDIRLVEGPGTYFLGNNENPQATLVFFSDFSCPYCKQSAETIGKLVIKYGDRIKIIIRDLPVVNEESLDLAMAFRCAGEQGRHWPMFFELFEKQGEFVRSGLIDIALSSGVADIDQFADCFNNQKYLNELKKDLSDGQYLKISGTPAWFINGFNAGEGAIPFSAWENFLDQLLAESEK